MSVLDEIVDLFEVHGASRYGGESVSQLTHALQCAALAEEAGAAPPLIGAALLHDIGHLVGAGDEGLAEQGIDARHEDLGAQWLARSFGAELTEPVRLHVTAKRCLCTIDTAYWSLLSNSSKLSMAIQGGPMSREDVERFLDRPFARDAIALRRWDDEAKDPERKTPGIAHFLPCLEGSVLRG